MWGPAAFSSALSETYLEAPNGSRIVQYFDKSRMEITNPAGDDASGWFVTNGLLVVEMVSGRLQVGDDAFVQLPPAALNVAGDPDDSSGPTYATVAGLRDVEPAEPGAVYTQRLARDGSVAEDQSLAARGAEAAVVDGVTRHAIARPIWEFMMSSGAVWDGDAVVYDRLFANPYYATGRPITEAYWASVKVGGVHRDVLLQCFERRCLTYTPDNPPGWKVEAGNVGRHYYQWRYESGHEFTTRWIAGASAATVAHGDVVELTIPVAGLSGPGIVSIAPASQPAPYPGLMPVSEPWAIDLGGATLRAPATLSLAFDPSRVPAGVPAGSVVVAWFDAASGVWAPASTSVDLAAGRVSATTDHLSIWQVFAPTQQSGGGDPPPTDPDPDPPTSQPPNVLPTVDLNGPDVAGTDATVAVQAGAGPVAIAPPATISDPDDDMLVSVVVELLDAADGADEWLSAAAAPSVVVSHDQDRHRVQLGGPSPVAAIQQVLRSVTYQHDGEQATPGTRRIAIRATDEDGTGSASTVIVTVSPAPENRAPEASDTTIATDEDVPVAVVLSAIDPDGDGLTWSIEEAPLHGTLGGDAPNLTYIPAQDYFGPDSFTWTASDGNAASLVATVAIEVRPVNDAPVASPASIGTDEDVSVAIVLAGADVDGDALTYAVASEAENGMLSGTAPNLTYTPSADYSGTDRLTFTVSDGVATSEPATVSITIRAVNDPPAAGEQQVMTDEDVPVAVTLSGADDGVDLSFAVAVPPAHGSLEGTAPNLVYTPDPDFNGSDAFTYTAADEEHVSEPATVSIVVNPVNDAPVASGQAVTLLEDGAQYLTLTASDVDGDVVRFTITRMPDLGNLSVDGDWRCVADGTARVCSHVVHYGVIADLNGTDSFEFTVNDGNATSAPATVSVTIAPVNDPPVARDDTVAGVNEDSSSVVLDVLSNDTTGPDEGEVLEVVAVDSFSAGGSALISGDVLHYTPAPDFYGAETFRYTVGDGNGGQATATVTVEVLAVNDPPAALDDTIEIDEDSGPVGVDPLANDTASPDRDETIVVVDYEAPSHGTLAIDAVTGEMTYTPDPGFNGVDAFAYTISDGNGGSATATVSVTVRPVNDPPVAVDDSIEVDEDGGPVTIDVLANDTSAPDDGETLVITAADQTPLGTVEVTEGGTAIRFVPAPDAHGSDAIGYTIADDAGSTATASVRLTVRPVNDAPVLETAAASASYVEDDPPLALLPDLVVGDVDSDIAGATVAFAARPDGASESLALTVSSPAITTTVDAGSGTVTLAGAASPAEYAAVLRGIHYVNSSQAPTGGERTLDLSVSDGDLTASLSVAVSVVPVNDPPVLGFGGVVRPEVGVVILDPDATLTDVDSPDFDGGMLSMTITGGYDAGDALSVQAAEPLGISGSSLTWGDSPAVVIGQIEVSDGLLVVSFTAAATPERVQAVVRALAFETTSGSAADRLVSVVVSDREGGGSETGIVTVGVNQPPDDITLSAAAVPEDATQGFVVGEISGSDPNGDALAFALADGSDERFEVVADGPTWQLRVAAGAAFDHEAEPPVTVTIRAADPAGRAYEEAFAIAVDDVNETPALVEPLSFDVPENSASGTLVGQVGVADPDAGQAHAFDISGGNEAGAFAIDPADGTITVADAGPLDFETTPSFALTVTVTDDGTPSLSAGGTVTIALTDVVEQIEDVTPPVVENLTYDGLIGNLRLRADAFDGLLSTSSDPEGSSLALVAAEAYGGPAFGALAWQSDGSFTWDPPVGARATAGSWQITVADAAGNQATGLVTFAVTTHRVWHVDNTTTVTTRTGRWDAPFRTLAEARNASATGDIIYLAAGNGPYSGGIELKPSQRLVGAGARGASFGAVLGLPGPERGAQELPAIGGTNPVITSSGAGLTLSSGNLVDGVSVGATSGAAIYGRGSGAVGPTLRNVAVLSAPAPLGPALDIMGYSGGSMSFLRIERALTQAAGSSAVVRLLDMAGTSVVVEGPLTVSSTTAAMRGLHASNVGSIELRGGVEVASTTGEGLYIEKTSVVRLTGAAPKTVATTGKAGVFVRGGSTFAVAGGGLSVTTTNANGLDVAGATVELAGTGNVIQTTGGIGLFLYIATIGPAGVALDAVSASGAANGIYANTITSDGPLVVGPAGSDDAPDAGGTITGTTVPAVVLQYVNNVTLRRLVIGAADAAPGEPASAVNAVAGAGIDAYVVNGLTLDAVTIARTGSHGIFGREVAGLTMTRSWVINAGDAPGEHALSFDGPVGGLENGLTGVALIADSVVDGFWDTGLVVRNVPTAPGVLDLTVARTTFAGNVVAGAGIRLRAEGLATMDVLVEGCAFDRLNGPTVDGQQVGTGVLNLVVR